ncbi:MAG TPA: hypothetical protein VNT32_07520 [Thermoleophilaceae bacterium]|nr:hypothetical protein [Thermoleophilaceae bacterium]
MTAAAAPADARPPIETILQDDAALLHRSDEEVGATMRHLRSLGVDRVRLTAGWSVLAPDADSATRPDFDASDPAAYPRLKWRMLDRAVRAANDAGVGVMIDIAFWAPLWATQGDPNEGRARWNIDPAEYAQFTAAVVKRYSGDFVPATSDEPEQAEQQPEQEEPSRDEDLLTGLFGGSSLFGEEEDQNEGGQAPPPAEPAAAPLPRVSWWTVWNEPNHPGFIQPQWERTSSGFRARSPHIYRRLVEASLPVIKGIQPDSLVLVGGTSSTGAKNPSDITSGVPPVKFVRELACVDADFKPLDAPECADYRPLQGDGFSHHPYSLLHKPNYGDPRNADNAPIGDLDRLTKTLDKLVEMRRIDPKIRDVYLTEFGYETNPPDPVKPFNPEQSARYINWAEYLAWKNPNVRSWPQFLIQDLGVVSAEDAARGKRDWGDWQSGLYFADGTPKPSATSFKLALYAECLPAPLASKASRQRGKRRSSRRRTARRASSQTVMIWGRVRPGEGPRNALLSVNVKNEGWEHVATAASSRRRPASSSAGLPFQTDAGGVFVRYAKYEPGVEFRIEHGLPGGQAEQGLPVRPTGCRSASRAKSSRKRAASKRKVAKRTTSGRGAKRR